MAELIQATLQANKAYPAGLTRIFGEKPVNTNGVIFHSHGTVLICGASAVPAADAARRLLARASDLRVVVFAPGIDAIADLPRAVTRVGGRIVSIKGHLGAFTATVPAGNGREEDAGLFSPNSNHVFDLVLDLFATPLLQASVPPVGYFAVGDSTTAVVRALETLPSLVGIFHKPKFFDYEASLCSHRVNGVAGCNRCLTVCAAQAIRASATGVEVDPYLCQGCASCALVCPSGAMRFPLPAASELAAGIARPGAPGEVRKDILLVHDAAVQADLDSVASTRLQRLEVNPLLAFNERLWLQALAQGYAGVRLLLSPTLPVLTRAAIQAKVVEMREILGVIGRDPAALAAVEAQDLAASIRGIAAVHTTSPVLPVGNGAGKRASLLGVIDGLTRKNLRKDAVPLPVGAPFGKVTVDARSCTLCLACVNICPTLALSGRMAPTPQIGFQESLCVQCGLCRTVCPEKSISLQPRFVTEPSRRNEIRIINRDELVPCSRCNTPFIGRHFLASSIKMMQARPGALPSAADFMRLCPSCRQRGITAT